ncbi:MAG: tetratricopeptide repeat protein [Sulfurimonas sp.]|jgi:tetratricopeptide (TPR) repeat protein
MTINEALQLAISHHKQGNLQEAEKLYRAILQTDSKQPDANHNLGIIAVSVGMIEAAIPFFKQAIESNPNIEQYYLSYNDAMSKIQNKISSSSNIDIIIAMFSQGKYEEALLLAEEFTKRFPDNGLGWKALGAILTVLGKMMDALESTLIAIKLLPEDSEVHSNLGAIYRNLGRLLEAEESLLKAITLDADRLEAHSNLGAILKYQARFSEAEESYRKVISLNPNHAEAYNNLGVVLNELNRLPEAEEAYRKAISVKPDYAEAYNNLGVALAIQKKIIEAEESYRKAIELKPDYAPTYHSLGVLLKDKGNLIEAEKSYRKAIFLKPDYAEVYSNLGHLLCFLDRTSEAIEAYKNSFSLCPSDIGQDATVYLAILQYLSGGIEESYFSLRASNGIVSNTDIKYKNSISYWVYLYNLISWYQDNKQENYQTNMKTLYVIGESHSLVAHNVVVQLHEQVVQCKSEWIAGCKQWHLGNKNFNQYKYKFEAVVARLPKESSILLTIGEIDCRYDEGIIKAWRKLKNNSLEDVATATIKSYLSYVVKMTEKYNHKLIICGVPASNNSESDKLSPEMLNQLVALIKIFNVILKKEVLDAGMEFLDIYALTNRGDGISNGQWHIDSHHLTPSAIVEAFEKYLLE